MSGEVVIVQVEILAVLDVGRIVEGEGLRPQVRNDFFGEGESIHLVEVDPASITRDAANASNEFGLVEACIDGPSAGLILPADHAAVDDAGVVGPVEEESSNTEIDQVRGLSLSVDRALLAPLTH